MIVQQFHPLHFMHFLLFFTQKPKIPVGIRVGRNNICFPRNLTLLCFIIIRNLQTTHNQSWIKREIGFFTRWVTN